MVDPSPFQENQSVIEKRELRTKMRALRRDHVASLPDATRALLFLRPPSPVAALAPEGTTVGLYHAHADEAPTSAYARWFYENGRTIALPWFEDRDAPMRFRAWCDPFEDSDLERGPFGVAQPVSRAEEVYPDVAMLPLLAFTPDGDRLGQGGGHYDQWLAAHPDTVPVGLGWDCQCLDSLPVEPHDRQLRAVITPTRFYQGAA